MNTDSSSLERVRARFDEIKVERAQKATAAAAVEELPLDLGALAQALMSEIDYANKLPDATRALMLTPKILAVLDQVYSAGKRGRKIVTR